jgi:hypothetical protein
MLTAFVVNVTLLGTMIVGVIHKRLDTRLWKLLYYQGLFWISAAIFTEVPGVVCHPFSESCLVHRIESFLLHYPGNALPKHQW